MIEFKHIHFFFVPFHMTNINIDSGILTTVSNDLSRANQIDMTGPNSVVLFAQTLVCSLCNYYINDNNKGFLLRVRNLISTKTVLFGTLHNI